MHELFFLAIKLESFGYCSSPKTWKRSTCCGVLQADKPPINLISVSEKLLAQVIEKRLREYVPRLTEQIGFNPSLGTRDNVLVHANTKGCIVHS
jgi:hypothetical protein